MTGGWGATAPKTEDRVEWRGFYVRLVSAGQRTRTERVPRTLTNAELMWVYRNLRREILRRKEAAYRA